jgi:hypothetical protein
MTDSINYWFRLLTPPVPLTRDSESFVSKTEGLRATLGVTSGPLRLELRTEIAARFRQHAVSGCYFTRYTQIARQPVSLVRALTAVRGVLDAKYGTPPVGLEPTTRRLTAACSTN